MSNLATHLEPLHGSDGHDSREDLQRRALRQLAVVRALSAGAALAPSLDDRLALAERAREQLLELERADARYSELGGGSLIADTEPRLAQLALPSSWPEACVACLLISLASRIALECRTSQDRTTLRALACEWERVQAARAALQEIEAESSPTDAVSSQVIARWASIGLESLDAERTRETYSHAVQHELSALGLVQG